MNCSICDHDEFKKELCDRCAKEIWICKRCYTTHTPEGEEPEEPTDRRRSFACSHYDYQTDQCQAIKLPCPYYHTKLDIVVTKPYACGWAELVNLTPTEPQEPEG